MMRWYPEWNLLLKLEGLFGLMGWRSREQVRSNSANAGFLSVDGNAFVRDLPEELLAVTSQTTADGL